MCNTRGAAAVAAQKQRALFFAPSLTVCAVVCVRLMTACHMQAAHRAVVVLDIHARVGASQQHNGQRCWPQQKRPSRHDLRWAGPVAAWWIDGFR